jgi:hypothetical protein
MITITVTCDKKNCTESKEYSGHLTIKKFEDAIKKDWKFLISKERKYMALCKNCLADTKDKIDKAVEKEEKDIYK